MLGFPVTDNQIPVPENQIASIIDPNAPVTLAIEVLRDGTSMRFEGVDARTYHDVEGVLLKMYNHTDARGTLGRIEVRAPKMKLCFAEIDAFLTGKQPLGRDRKIEALTVMVEVLSRGYVMMKREVNALRHAVQGLCEKIECLVGSQVGSRGPE